MNASHLLALVMQRQGLTSYRQIGFKIGVNGVGVAGWAAGRSNPTDENIILLCKLADEDPAHWIVSIRFEAANPRTRSVWAEIYQTISESKKTTLPFAS